VPALEAAVVVPVVVSAEAKASVPALEAAVAVPVVVSAEA